MTTSPSPMDITIQNPIETTAISHDLSDGNGVALPSSSPSPILTHRKFLVSGTPPFFFRFQFYICFFFLLILKLLLFFFGTVEVCLKPSSTARVEDVRLAVER